MNDQPCSPDELRALFLFEKLTDDQLGWLCQRGRTEVLPVGPVYTEGDPATTFYVLLEGTLVLSRLVGGDDIEAGRTSQRGVYAGATVNQVVLAWLIGAEIPVIPLVGASSVAQLDESLAAVDLELTAQQRARLDAAG